MEFALAALASSASATAVSPWVTAGFGALLVAMIAVLALEEWLHVKKSLVTGGFAVLCLLLGAVCGLLPFEHGPGHMPVYVGMIEWEVVVIILASGLFVDVTSRSGLFTWIAIRLTKVSGGDPRRLLLFYGTLTVVFSAVLNNVTAMIIIGSLTAVSLERLGRREALLGFLLVEGLLTNVGGLLTLISSVPNIIVGQAAGISFVAFFVRAAPYVLLATVATLLLGARRFRIRPLASERERQEAAAQVASFDERDGVESETFFWWSVALFCAFIVAVATTSVLPYVRDLGMGFVVAAFAVIALLRYRASVDRFYQAVDWDLLGFFVGLFIVIGVMERARVLEAVGHGIEAMLGLGETAGSGLLLVSASAFSSVTDNIPLAAMLARILHGIGTAPDSGLWWSVVFGANLGGNLTPIGSASTIVAVTIMHKYDVKLSFGRFVALAAPFAIAQILLAVGYVWLVAH